MNQPPATLRIPFVRRCLLHGSNGATRGMLLDLSIRGAYVASEALPSVGEGIEVAFQVPGNARELKLKSRVAWVQSEQTHPVHGLPRGFGVRFTSLDVEDIRLIARAIRDYCLSNPIYRQYL